MPKHNQGTTPNATKNNDFTSSYKIIISTNKTEINVKSKDVATYLKLTLKPKLDTST
jgi:hypothetical protein